MIKYSFILHVYHRSVKLVTKYKDFIHFIYFTCIHNYENKSWLVQTCCGKFECYVPQILLLQYKAPICRKKKQKPHVVNLKTCNNGFQISRVKPLS